ETRALPAAESMVSERHRGGEINADHAYFDAAREVAGGVAVAGEDGNAIAVLVLRGEPHCFFIVFGAHDREHRPEYFLLVDSHRRLDLVEQAAAHEVAVLVALQLEAAAID